MPAPDGSRTDSEARPGAAVVHWTECPRDAWQGLPRTIPTERKRAHLVALLEAGFARLDMGSFVSPRSVPQLADTEDVLAGLPPSAELPGELLGIVGNLRGLERAAATRARASSSSRGRGVDAIGYPLSVDDTFQRRNLGRSIADSWAPLAEMLRAASDVGLRRVVYLSMGFGNPYGAPWTPADTARALARLRELEPDRIVLADTVGRADAETIHAVLDACDAPQTLGLHLHARPDAWAPLLSAALDHGVRAFEGALSGLGGCPFAGDVRVGNLPTERVLPWLRARGLRVAATRGTDPAAATVLAPIAGDAAAIGATYGGSETEG